jgi:hypothetical protein
LHCERQATLALVIHAIEVTEHAERVITLADGKIVGNERKGKQGRWSTVN